MKLQVRQLQMNVEPVLGGLVKFNYVNSYGEWLDVVNPSWLLGFVIPHPGLAYEFRQTEEDT